jgi:hypothetical protein
LPPLRDDNLAHGIWPACFAAYLRGGKRFFALGQTATIGLLLKLLLRCLGLLWPLAVVTATGCLGNASPAAGCLADSDCPSGQCMAGVCVAAPADALLDDGQPIADGQGVSDGLDTSPADSTTGSDLAVAMTDVVPDGSPDLAGGDLLGSNEVTAGSDTGLDSAGGLTCSTPADCLAYAGETPPCASAQCVKGLCVWQASSIGAFCVVAGPCPTPGTCGTEGCIPTKAICDDNEACTLDICTVKGCTHANWAEGTFCATDDEPCSSGTCLGGVCQAALAQGWCRIDGACVAADTASAAGPCLTCQPQASTSNWSLVVGGPCSDGNTCTTEDVCSPTGQCAGTPVVCADEGPCLLEICQPGLGCTGSPALGTCTDGNPCTTGDFCQGGVCSAKGSLDCDDATPCTADSCITGYGCLHLPVLGSCQADDDPCTADTCVGGQCLGVPLVSVCQIAGTCVPSGQTAAGNSCLLCDPAQSLTTWTPRSGVACDDGNACSEDDTCDSGSCAGVWGGPCDDNEPCTSDSCDPGVGCVHAAIAAPCTDSDLCTTSDSCLAGQCKGQPLSVTACDDGQPCTLDTCLAWYGCSHTPTMASCDDGSSCTSGDHCEAGRCIAKVVTCACVEDEDCDDGNACTADTCPSDKSCEHLPQTGQACDDGNDCTTADSCAEGVCFGFGQTNCDDGEACTADYCAADSGCSHVAKAGQVCNDGNACTTGELCASWGGCGAPPALACNDGNPCTLDLCNPATGACLHPPLPAGTACLDDGITCTEDKCQAGVCRHDQLAANTCLIEGSCWAAGKSHPTAPCLACLPETDVATWTTATGLACEDGNACTSGDACSPAGFCVGAPVYCDDNNPCTTGICDPLSGSAPCSQVPKLGSCDDGNACTTGDSCSGAACKGATTVCDDGNACTIDVCSPVAGCLVFAAANGQSCPGDGVACTVDTCQDGTCNHVLDVGHCLIDGQCLQSGAGVTTQPCLACDPLQTQTGWSPAIAAVCTDDNVCTTADQCVAGSCVGQVAVACDDGNPCSLDSCDPVTGCTALPINDAVCDDGEVCTVSGTCVAGTCVSSPLDCSGQAGPCETSWCEPGSGCRTASLCGPLHGCDNGLCVTLGGGTPGPVVVGSLGSDWAPHAPSLAYGPAAQGPAAEADALWLALESRACPGGALGAAEVGVVHFQPGATSPTWATLPASAGHCILYPAVRSPEAGATGMGVYWLAGSNGNGNPADASPLCSLQEGGALQWATWQPGAATDPPALVSPVHSALCANSALPYPPGLQSSGTVVAWLQAGLAGVVGWQGQPGALQLIDWTDALAASGPVEPVVVVAPAGSPASPGLVLVRRAANGAWQSPDLWQSSPFPKPVLLGGIAAPAGLPGAVTIDSLSASWDNGHQEVVVAMAGRAGPLDQQLWFVATARLSLTNLQPVVAELVAVQAAPTDVGNVPMSALRALRIVALPVQDASGPRRSLMAYAVPNSGDLHLVRVESTATGLTVAAVAAGPAVSLDPVTNLTAASGYGELSELSLTSDHQRLSLAWIAGGQVQLWTLPAWPQ